MSDPIYGPPRPTLLDEIEGRWRARYLTWIDGRADEAPSGHLLAADVWDVVERPSGFLPPLSIGIDRRLDEGDTLRSVASWALGRAISAKMSHD